MLIYLLFIMDRWLKRGSLGKQSRTVAVSSGIRDVKSESPCFTSPSIIGVYGTSESSTKWKYSDSYFSLGFTYTGVETVPDALCVLCNEVLPNSSMLPATRGGNRDTNHPDYKDRVITFIWLSVEALTNCLTRIVKSSKTGNEKVNEASSRQSYCTALAT
jgi:hypothetical protein